MSCFEFEVLQALLLILTQYLFPNFSAGVGHFQIGQFGSCPRLSVWYLTFTKADKPLTKK